MAWEVAQDGLSHTESKARVLQRLETWQPACERIWSTTLLPHRTALQLACVISYSSIFGPLSVVCKGTIC